MVKILLVCDGGHFPTGAFEFIKEHYAEKNALVIGVFLNSVQYANLFFSQDASYSSLMTAIIDEDQEIIERNISLFKEVCEKSHLEYRVHVDDTVSIFPLLKKETRFADLMVLSSESFYKNVDYAQPNGYTKTALHEAECPVLLLPDLYDKPDHVVLAYDGSANSVFAIKEFAATFPEYTKLEAILVYVNGGEKEIPCLAFIEELAGRHFPKLKIERVPFDGEKYFDKWITGEKHCILVAGSFSRPGVSMFFKRSFVSSTIREHEIPVFISHH